MFRSEWCEFPSEPCLAGGKKKLDDSSRLDVFEIARVPDMLPNFEVCHPRCVLNLLKATGHVMHQQFDIQQMYALPTRCVYVFCIYLRTNSDLCHLQHKLIGFYNRDEKCLQRGTDWVFKYSGLPFVLKGQTIR